MKKFSLLLLLVGITSLAQIKGNKYIITKSYDLQNLTQLEMNLYASVTIDLTKSKEAITITADSNLISQIDTEVVDGKMRLTQLDWIQPSQDIKITINAPQLQNILVDVHETVEVIGVKKETLSLTAILGKIKAYGSVEVLRANSKKGIVDASSLLTNKAILSIWDDGKILVNAKTIKTNKLSNEARVVSLNKKATVDPKLKKSIRSRKFT